MLTGAARLVALVFLGAEVANCARWHAARKIGSSFLSTAVVAVLARESRVWNTAVRQPCPENMRFVLSHFAQSLKSGLNLPLAGRIASNGPQI
jgi:hypothetical protein